jgi:hypothetical protein
LPKETEFGAVVDLLVKVEYCDEVVEGRELTKLKLEDVSAEFTLTI